MNQQLVAQLPPWSYSFLNEYSICPYRCFRQQVARDVPWVDTAAKSWGNKVHKGMDERISAGKPLTGDMAKFEPWAAQFDGKKVETELRLGVRQDGTTCGFYDPCYGHMRIDLAFEPGDGTARLFDWKTGKVREDDFELRLQALLVQARNPALRSIHAWYVWLGDGPAGKLGARHDVSDIERTWAEVDSMMHTIRMNAAINHWPKREGPLCGYCDVKNCEHNKSKG